MLFSLIGAILGLLREGYREAKLRLFDGPVYHRYLLQYLPYYRHLPLSKKGKFLRVVRDNEEYFEFIPRGIPLTRAMRTIVAGGAAQITFYLAPEALNYFEKIIIYPEPYHSRLTGKNHKGEVNPGMRVIVLSWRAVMDGLDRETDGLNLLLHEFAHALWLEHRLVGHAAGILDPRWVSAFEELAEREIQEVQDNEHHFFRKYAFSNKEEFFAVAVENFFERSYLFRKQFPDLYVVLSNLLKQNPAKD